MAAFVEPVRAFLDDVLGDDLRSLRVMVPGDDDLHHDVHHYLRDDIREDYDDDRQNCIGREVLEERWADGDGAAEPVEHAIYSYEEIEVVMVFEGTERATAVTFEAGAAGDLTSFADHVRDIIVTEISAEQ